MFVYSLQPRSVQDMLINGFSYSGSQLHFCYWSKKGSLCEAAHISTHLSPCSHQPLPVTELCAVQTLWAPLDCVARVTKTTARYIPTVGHPVAPQWVRCSINLWRSPYALDVFCNVMGNGVGGWRCYTLMFREGYGGWQWGISGVLTAMESSLL